MAFNETAAHFMPASNDDAQLSDQLIKLDVGVSVNGAIGDNATTVDLSGEWSDLIKASREAVDHAVRTIDIDVPIRQIGKEIQDVISSHGDFTSIKNLSGHGLAPYTIHCRPTIPNYDNSDDTPFSPGMTFACEPFATTGKGLIYDAGDGWIFRMIERKPIRDPVARKLMDRFEVFNGLPFSLFQIEIDDLPFFKLRVALKQMERAGIIEVYGALVEEGKGMVSQAEHSVLIDDDGKKWVTTR
jgi:methionyl aminopeptidase